MENLSIEKIKEVIESLVSLSNSLEAKINNASLKDINTYYYSKKSLIFYNYLRELMEEYEIKEIEHDNYKFLLSNLLYDQCDNFQDLFSDPRRLTSKVLPFIKCKEDSDNQLIMYLKKRC